MFNAVMVVYVRFVQSVSNVVFVFNFGVATAVFSEVDLIFPAFHAVVNTILPHHNKSLHDDSITRFRRDPYFAIALHRPWRDQALR